jgi:hypothetical protein
VGFFGFPGLAYPTSDGRWLRVTEGRQIDAELSLRNETRLAERIPDSEEDWEASIGTDILSADLRLADADGRLWLTSSRFDAELFLSQMVDVARMDPGIPLQQPRHSPRRTSRKREPEITGDGHAVYPFGGGSRKEADCPPPVLPDVRFFSDDRMIREVPISVVEGESLSTRVVEWQFKYSYLSFDVAYHRPAPNCSHLGHLLELRVRLNEGSAFEYHSAEEISPLGFGFRWEHLMRNNCWSKDEGGRWHHSTLPLPLVFRAVEGGGAPQPHVVVA